MDSTRRDRHLEEPKLITTSLKDRQISGDIYMVNCLYWGRGDCSWSTLATYSNIYKKIASDQCYRSISEETLKNFFQNSSAGIMEGILLGRVWNCLNQTHLPAVSHGWNNLPRLITFWKKATKIKSVKIVQNLNWLSGTWKKLKINFNQSANRYL